MKNSWPESSSARTEVGIIDHSDPTFTLLADIGFALVMFVVGTHVPVRDSTIARLAIPKSLLRAVLVGAVAAVLGVTPCAPCSAPATPRSTRC